MLLAQLVKLAVKAAHHLHNLLWLRLNAELGNPCDFCSKESHILEVVDHFLVVFDTLEHVFRDQLGQQLLSPLDLNINYSVVIINLPGAHLSSVDQQHEEEAVDGDHDTVRDVSLDVDALLNDMPVVLDQQEGEHDAKERGKLSELERAAVEGDHQVKRVGHKLRFSVDQVLVGRSD